jgi:hypothetical protein
LGSSPYGPDAPRPYRHALCADISSGEPYPFTKVPDGPQTYNLNVLWVQEGTQIYFSFLSKQSQQMNHFQVPQWSPFGERYPFAGHFYISLETLIKISLDKKFFKRC